MSLIFSGAILLHFPRNGTIKYIHTHLGICLCIFQLANLIKFSKITVPYYPAGTLIKKEKNIFLIYLKIKRDRLQSHMWLTASSYIGKILHISSYIRKPVAEAYTTQPNSKASSRVLYCTCISVVWRDDRWNKGMHTDE